MTEARRAVMQREVSVMTHLKGSPFMVELQCVEDDEMYHYLVMAKCPGRTLLELMAEGGGRVLEARLASDVVPSLLGALVLTHRRRVVHSDLRPEHIICQRGCVKLLDWASAVDMSLENAVARGTGAVAYMAPEVANKPSLADAFHMVRACVRACAPGCLTVPCCAVPPGGKRLAQPACASYFPPFLPPSVLPCDGTRHTTAFC